MFELFAAISLWAWIFIIAEIVLLFVLVENDKAGGAGISLVVFGLALQFIGGIDVFGTIWNNPLYLIVFLLIYLVIGTVWAISKWYIHVKKIARKYREIKAEFLHERKLEPGDPLDDHQRSVLMLMRLNC